MLRLSTKGQYGVRAMFEIAKNYQRGPIKIRDIAEKQELSVSYLQQILNQLRREGLIHSHKGPGGGYVLSKGPADISVSRILRALEGPIAITRCLDPGVAGCRRVEGCVARLLWKSLGEQIEQFLETISLRDLLKEDSKIWR